jgi:hypothetical protein
VNADCRAIAVDCGRSELKHVTHLDLKLSMVWRGIIRSISYTFLLEDMCRATRSIVSILGIYLPIYLHISSSDCHVHAAPTFNLASRSVVS